MPLDKIPLKNGSVKILSGINGEYINKGTYYIAEISKTDNSDIITVMAYDSAYRLNKIYEPDIEYPSNLSAVISILSKGILNFTVTLLLFISPIFNFDSLKEISSKVTDITSSVNSLLLLKIALTPILRLGAMTDFIKSALVLIILLPPLL